jgi:translation initiation factor IF-2
MEKKSQTIITRPPIVVILGHIDHGKSSLLEAIKDFRITAKESGGITQHIGAYQIEEKKRKITFLDTPGHEAFSQMRSRGAKIADIAVLVIDATEGLKPQTKEVLLKIKETKIPFIVALNKIDKPEANPEKVKRELVKEEILVVSMGGKIPSVEVSSKTGQGIPELLELILLVAEMEKLETDLQKPAEGVVIESYLDNLRGPTSTLLLTVGVLKTGEIVGTRSAFTKIKSLENFQKKSIEKAFPSDPVIVFGFNQVPKIGEEFRVFADLESAQDYLKIAEKKVPEVLEISEGQRILNLIIKADVVGSLEAIEGILINLPQEKVILRILKSEVGNINESDLKLATGGKAIILGFRVKIDVVAKKISEREKIKIITFEVIYDLVEEVRKLMERFTIAEEFRTDLGKMKVLAKFLAEKNRQIIGGRVTEGEVQKGASIEVIRNEERVGSGRLINLQRNKKDADLISRGEECGILFEGDVKIEEGDILIFYKEERRKNLL